LGVTGVSPPETGLLDGLIMFFLTETGARNPADTAFIMSLELQV
jgi:hypothetical protein